MTKDFKAILDEELRKTSSLSTALEARISSLVERGGASPSSYAMTSTVEQEKEPPTLDHMILALKRFAEENKEELRKVREREEYEAMMGLGGFRVRMYPIKDEPEDEPLVSKYFWRTFYA